jgi:sterol desaturase/sphingolipid hydroxylase (fatty acid hydroxylase superfamily)
MPADPFLLFLLLVCQLSLIIGVRYLVVSGAFAWLAARRRPEVYRPAEPAKRERLKRQVRREIGWSLLSALLYGAPAALAATTYFAHGGTRLYTDIGQYPLWWLPASVALYLLAHDAWFYWTHRAMHHWPALFRAAHAVHHESRPPTAWAAMSFHPWEALSAAWLYPAMVFLVPIHVGALGLVLTIATFMAVTNHMGFEIFPKSWVHGWFGRHVITASHHDLHHSRYNSNYGLYFRFWDRLFGTDVGLRPNF